MKKIYKAELMGLDEEKLERLEYPLDNKYLSVRTDLKRLETVFCTPTVIPDVYKIRNSKKYFRLYDPFVLHSIEEISKMPIGLLVYNKDYNNFIDYKEINEYDMMCKGISIDKYLQHLIDINNAYSYQYLKKNLTRKRLWK